jgi:hypothetical protein
MTRQVWDRKTNASEPPMKRRNTKSSIKTGGFGILQDAVHRKSGYWVVDARRIGGVRLSQAQVGNYGNQSPRCEGRIPSGGTARRRVPKRGTGADQLVRALKAGNAAGAKGLGQTAALAAQLFHDRRRL